MRSLSVPSLSSASRSSRWAPAVVLVVCLPFVLVCGGADPTLRPIEPRPAPVPLPAPGDPAPAAPVPGDPAPAAPAPAPAPDPAPAPAPRPEPSRPPGMRALILGGGKSAIDAQRWREDHVGQITAAGELLTFAPDYPRSVVSGDVPGLNPGFVVVVAGYCPAGASERVVRVLERVLPETYERIVQVDPAEGASCPKVR